MLILSLDQALQTTGWAVFKDGELIAHGIFKTRGSAPIGERLRDLEDHVAMLFFDYEESIDFIAFEDIQNQNNNETYKKLAYCQAVLHLWCAKHFVKYEVLSPSHWRSVLGGGFGRKREEQKKAAIEYVKNVCGEDVTSDEADAICLGLAAIKEFGKSESAF